MWKKTLMSLLVVGVIVVLLSVVGIVSLLCPPTAFQENRVVARLAPVENHNESSLSFKGEVLATSMEGGYLVFYGTQALEAKQYEGLIGKKFIVSFYDHNDKIIIQKPLEPVTVGQFSNNSGQYVAISGDFFLQTGVQFLGLEIEKVKGSDLPPVKSVEVFAWDGDARFARNIGIILLSMIALICASISVAFLYTLLDIRKKEKRLAPVNHS